MGKPNFYICLNLFPASLHLSFLILPDFTVIKGGGKKAARYKRHEIKYNVEAAVDFIEVSRYLAFNKQVGDTNKT